MRNQKEILRRLKNLKRRIIKREDIQKQFPSDWLQKDIEIMLNTFKTLCWVLGVDFETQWDNLNN